MKFLSCAIVFSFLFVFDCDGILYPKDSEVRQSKSLDGIWNFRISDLGDPDQGFNEEWYKSPLGQSGEVIPMPVPSSFNDITQSQEIRDFIGWAWYDREFFVSQDWKNQRIVLRFGSVHYYASVYVNGIVVTNHRGGHLPFEVDISKQLKFNGSNLLTVAVNNTLSISTIPQGKITYFNDTRIYPENFYEFDVNFDFFNYAGIHRSVILYTTPSVYISDVTIVTSYDFDTYEGLVNYAILEQSSTHLYSISARMRMDDAVCDVFVLDKSGQTVGRATGCLGKIVLSSPTLWWPYTMSNDPGYLYTLKVVMTSWVSADVYYQDFGIRTVQVNETDFLINRQPFYFTGFGKHEDANVRGKGLDLPMIVKDINLIKWIGANSFRTSHYPYSEELMDQADRQGVVVIDECPAVGLSKFNDVLLDAHLVIMEELVARDKNRPSVVMYSVANEPKSTMTQADNYFRKVVKHTKKLDPTRPVTAALNTSPKLDQAMKYLDVIMVNRYFTWYTDHGYLQLAENKVLDSFRTIRGVYSNKPVMISEYGADTIPGFHMNPSMPFTEDYQTEFMAKYHRAFDQLRKEGGFVGEHIWNFADFMTKQQLTRIVGNKKGIFTRERQPKAAAKFLRCRYLQIANMTIPDDAVYCPYTSNLTPAKIF